MDVANLLLKVTGDGQDARRALREVREEMRRLASEEFKAQVEIAGVEEAKARVRGLEQSLDVIGRRNVTARVRVDVGDAKAKLAALRAELDLAGKGGPGARPVGDILGDIGRLGDDVDRTSRRTSGLSAAFRELFSSKSQVDPLVKSNVGLFRGLGTSVLGAGRGFFTLGTILLILLPILSSILGIVAALAASFTFALAGVGLLAIAFVGTLIPAALVAVAAVMKLTQVVKAAKEQQEKEADAADKVANARASLVSANRRVTDSTQAVADAQDQLRSATTSAWEAYHDSIEQVKDDLLDVQYAQLGVQQADLNVRKAAEALKNALGEAGVGTRELTKKFTNVDFSGADGASALDSLGVGGGSKTDVLQAQIDYKRALLDQKKAQDEVGDSQRQLTRDRRDEAAYLSKGILANEGYRSALRGVEQAQQAVVAATAQRDKAERSLANALRDQQKIVEQMTPETRRLADQYERIKDRVVSIFGPLGEKVLRGGVDAADDFTEALSDDGVKGGLDEVAEALADLLRELGELANSPGGKEFFETMAKGAARLVRALGTRAGLSLLRVLGRLAQETLPFLLSGADHLADTFERWDEGTKNTNRLSRTIRSIIGSLRDWLGLARSVGRVFLAFVRDGKEEGDGFVRTLTRMFNRLADFLNTKEGRESVKSWLRDSIQFGKDFASILRELLPILKAIVDTVNLAVRGYAKVVELKNAISEGAETAGKERDEVDSDVSIIKDLTKRLKSGKDKQGDPLTAKGREGLRTGIANVVANTIQALKDQGFSDDQIEAILKRAGVNPDGSVRRRWGGIIPGVGGFGDKTRVLAEGGEYMIRRSVVQSLGLGTLDALNAGLPLTSVASTSRATSAGARYEINLPPAPAAAVPDARYQAVQLARELERRGG